MSLTKKDLQQIKEMMSETFKPEFDHMDRRFDRVESRLDKVENKIDTIENPLIAVFRAIVNDIYDLHPSKEPFNNLEGRVSIIERKINSYLL